MNASPRNLESLVLAFALSVACCAAQATTIAHWTFDEQAPGTVASGANAILDISGNGHHGTPFGNPTYAAYGSGTGLEFDGSEIFWPKRL